MILFLVMECFCCLFKRYVGYITKNAFIQCGLHGKGFCDSSRDAHALVRKHMDKFFSTEVFSTVFKLSGSIFILTLNAACFLGFLYYLLSIDETFGEIDVLSDLISFSILITGVVIFLFMSVFDTVARSILHCHILDIDINEQLGRSALHNAPQILVNFVNLNATLNEEKKKKQAKIDQANAAQNAIKDQALGMINN